MAPQPLIKVAFIADNLVVENSVNQTGEIKRQKMMIADRYEVISVIGKGAAGSVYHALDHSASGREVALKILTNSNAFDENTMARFLEEIEACQLIRHPNIVQAYDCVKTEQGMAFSMEYVCGTDLARVIQERALSWSELDSIMDQLLAALQELHTHGIVHRDIKLENVLLDKSGNVKLTDLGLLKRVNDEQGLTRTGVLLGTAQYMPPEYVKAGIYDVRSDIYACGLLLYELISGKRRLQGKKGNEVLNYLIETGFKTPRLTNGAFGPIPERYLEIIDRALDPRPRRRFQSADEMRAAFNPECATPADERVESELSERPLLDESFGRLGSSKATKRSGTFRNLINNLKSILGIVFLVVLGGIPAAMKYGSDLPLGSFSGVISAGSEQIAKQAELLIGSEGSAISLGLEGCTGGVISKRTGYIACNRPNVRAETERSSDDAVTLRIFDEASNRAYQGTLLRKAK